MPSTGQDGYKKRELSEVNLERAVTRPVPTSFGQGYRIIPVNHRAWPPKNPPPTADEGISQGRETWDS